MKIISKNHCRIRFSPEAIRDAMLQQSPELNEMINAVIADLCQCPYFERVVFKFVRDQGGDHHKAEEVLEDGLIKLSELIRQGKYEGGKIEALAIQVCKNIWLNRRRKKDEQVRLTGDPLSIDSVDEHTPEHQIMASEKESVLQEILDHCLDADCRKLLQMKWIEGFRHDFIAETLGLANANSSKEKLNRCKKNALNCIERNPHFEALMQSVDFYLKK